MLCMKKLIVLLLLFCGTLTCCTTLEEKKANMILSMASPKSQILLHGKTLEEIRQIMGTPTFVRKEKPHESWVFKLPDCAVFVFFDENGQAAFTEAKGTCDKDTAKRFVSEKKNNLM